MPDLLLELFSEEIPARMQSKGAQDLACLVGDGLKAAGCEYGLVEAHATPRRLMLWIEGLPEGQPDVREERKGPRVDAPLQAVNGFLKAAGVSIEDCEQREDKKGTFYVAHIEKKGRATADVIAEIVPDVIRKFPWPKSMRWGTGSLRWVRPLHSILCLFGPDVVPFDVDGIQSGNQTRGHRFMSDGEPFNVTSFENYGTRLEAAKVILEADARAVLIKEQATAAAQAQGLELIEDEGLLRETAGLVEWPVVLMGTFDESFLELPPEVIITSIKSHQKCFSVCNPETGKLSNHFILISNLEAEDGGQKIIEGNQRVIAARLADAKFFWDQDLRIKLEDRLPQLERITFHAKLGTQAERVERIAELASEMAERIGVEVEEAVEAARLCKADLVTGMVGEFPELQGLMGSYYAKAEHLDPGLADALATHYKPQGPLDQVPERSVSQAVALADKLDMLSCFWAIDEKPTGSKDPFALRRAALGIIRIVLEKHLKLPLAQIVRPHLARPLARHVHRDPEAGEKLKAKYLDADADPEKAAERWEQGHKEECIAREMIAVTNDLLTFFADRLKVYLRDQGARHDLIDAVYALGGQDDLVIIVKRVEALGTFLDTEDGQNLLAGFKRAANILVAEQRKKTEIAETVNPELFDSEEERALFAALETAENEASTHIAGEDFAGAMIAFARLRSPVDAFFDAVMVNADDRAIRANRLGLLTRIRAAALQVADFSKISG